MSTEHTPGTWQIEHEATRFSIRANKETVLSFREGTFPRKEDACLIAAAPELLAALQDIVEAMNAERLVSGGKSGAYREAGIKLNRSAGEAIKKATTPINL